MSTGDRESSSIPGAARIPRPSTVVEQPAASIAAAHQTTNGLVVKRMATSFFPDSSHALTGPPGSTLARSNTVQRVSVFAAATGIGSWPGTSARDAAEIVVGELHTLPHLVELPARGVGADIIGRAGALLVDIGIDTVPRGYRIASRRNAVTRRAASLLGEDVDALEEAWEKAGLRGGTRTVKVQAPGPITLAAQLELPNGHRAITDAGALRDLAGSLAEGVAALRAQVARRLETPVVVQFDEPVVARRAGGPAHGSDQPDPGASRRRVGGHRAAGRLCFGRRQADVVLHSCAPGLSWKMLQRSTIQAISVDISTLAPADLDGIGEFVESGRTVLLGVVPTTAPLVRPSVEEVAKAAVAVTDRLGFPRAVLSERIGVTPACGLAGSTPEWARIAIELVQKAADAFAEDPDAI